MYTFRSSFPQLLARSLSLALHPSVLPLYPLTLFFTATAFALFPWRMRLYLIGSVLLFGTVLPWTVFGVLRVREHLSGRRPTPRYARILPPALGTVCYLLCALALARVGQAVFLRKFVLAAACCGAICSLAALRRPISLHLTGMGSLVALLTVLNILGLPAAFRPLLVAVVMSGALASARLLLGRDDPWQLLAGGCCGFFVTSVVLLFL